MLGIFRPSVNLINRLRYPQKLIFLGTIVVVIVLALMYEVSEQAITHIEFSERELLGLEVSKPLISLMRKIQEYRTAKNRMINNLSTEEEVRAARIMVDHSMVEMAEIIKKTNPQFNLMERWEQIKNEWDIIKLTTEIKPSYGRNTDLIPNIQKLLVTACDASNLTVDPEIDTFYLIDSYCTIIPRFTESISNLQDIGVASLFTKSIAESDLDYLFVINTLTRKFSLPSINENIDKAVAHNERLTDQFSNIVRILNQDTEKALRVVTETILAEKLDYSLDEYNNNFIAVKADSDQLIARTATSITALIQQRIHKLENIFYTNLAVVVVGLLIFAYLFIGIYFSIIQSIRKLVVGADEIAKGNLKAKVKLESQDELSQVADSFNTMRETLRSIVAELHDVVTAVGRGNLDQRVDLSNKEGFSRELSSNINKMTDVFQGIIKDMITVLDFLSKGNLTIRVTREYHGTFAELKTYVNDTIDNLETLIKSIKNSTETIRHAAEEISLGNSDLEKRTEQQAASLEQTSVSMGKMTGTVQQNSESAKEAHDYVQAASTIALEGGEVVNQVVVMMNAISESARQITEITNVIDSIAFQTNILALNAAVEAARAGEQGRGFTVVASEIRNLAQRSSVSAQGIKTLINTSVEQVIQGKKLADEAGKTMKQVVDSVKNVTDTMSQIVSASIEQTYGIQQINSAISQMDQVTQQNSALVEEAARSSESLKKQTEQMNDLVNVFKISSDQEKLEKRQKYMQGIGDHGDHGDHDSDNGIYLPEPRKKKKKFKAKESMQPSDIAATLMTPLKDTPSTVKPEQQPESKPVQQPELKPPPAPDPKENPDEWTEF